MRLARHLRCSIADVLALSWTEVQLWMEEHKRFPIGPEVQYQQLALIAHSIYQAASGKRTVKFKPFAPLLFQSQRFEGVDRDIAEFLLDGM